MTVGVIGTGRIGAAVIDRLRGFGCRALAYDARPKTSAEYVTLDALLERSDIVTLHTPLTAETHHLLKSHRAAETRLWHRRRDNLGPRIRRAMFMAYSYRWLTSRDTPFENVPEWRSLPPIRRQLLGDKTVDPFYWAAGELPLDPRCAGLQEAA